MENQIPKLRRLDIPEEWGRKGRHRQINCIAMARRRHGTGKAFWDYVISQGTQTLRKYLGLILKQCGDAVRWVREALARGPEVDAMREAGITVLVKGWEAQQKAERLALAEARALPIPCLPVKPVTTELADLRDQKENHRSSVLIDQLIELFQANNLPQEGKGKLIDKTWKKAMDLQSEIAFQGARLSAPQLEDLRIHLTRTDRSQIGAPLAWTLELLTQWFANPKSYWHRNNRDLLADKLQASRAVFRREKGFNTMPEVIKRVPPKKVGLAVNTVRHVEPPPPQEEKPFSGNGTQGHLMFSAFAQS